MRFLLLLGVFFSFNVFAQFECPDKHCMIVVDSGSTGSRAYLYQYNFSSSNTPLLIEELASKRLSPGLASIANDEGALKTYLSKLFSGFDQAQMKLPVYYYSTAGMRLLSTDKQKVIYRQVENWFSTQEHFDLKGLGTISGHDEGVYGWLAVNYLAGSFSPKTTHNKKVGMMDFGGASVQVSMALSDDKQADPKDITEVMVSGTHYRIFSKSYLGLGINELSHQFLNDKTCFSDNYPLPDGKLGEGDVEQCEKHIQLLTNKLHHVNIIQLHQLATSVDKWFALGALEGLSESVPYQDLPESLTLAEIMSMAQQGACHTDWEKLKLSDPNNQYLYNACFAGAYYYALIINGYGLSESTLIDTKIDGNTKLLDWTYGVVIKNHS